MARGAHPFAELRQDLAYGIRTLTRSPGFAAIVVLTLALGIGANTAIFTLIDAVLLRTLDVPRAAQLVAIGNPTRVSSASIGNPRADLFSYQLYRDIRADNPFVSGILADGRTGRLDIVVDRSKPGQAAEHASGRMVSGNYFSLLGVRPAYGRLLTDEDERVTGGAPVVVISDGYWKRRFAGDPATLNRTITVNGTPYTIVGIAERRFSGIIVGASTDIWIPLSMQPQIMAGRNWLDDRTVSWLLLMGRLSPGTSLAKAIAGIPPLTRRALSGAAYASGPAQVTADEVKGMTIPVSDGSKGFSRVRADFRTPLLTLMAGVGLLLLIVCANVANLLLARAVARDREIGVRLALGASRGRIVRQLLTESTALGLAGATLGLLLAWWSSKLLLRLAASGPVVVGLDLPVLGFTALVALITVALFGLAPAFRATRMELATTMRSSARAIGGTAGARGNRLPFGRLLIASQVALSLLLLVSAGLLVRSLSRVENADLGLDRDHLIIADLDPDPRRYPPTQMAAMQRSLLERVSRVPGVAAVSLSENGIFSGTESSSTMQIEGFTASAPADTVNAYDQVGPGYFRTIGARIIAGRDFNVNDNEQAAPVAVVNESMARFYFHGPQAAIGKMLHLGTDALPIVGVVGDAKDHDLTSTPVRRVYSSYFHRPVAYLGAPGSTRLEVRTTGDPVTVVRAVRAAIAAEDSDLRILGVDPLSVLMAGSLAQEHLVTRLALGFGIIALVLSAIGLYGVMSYTVARRTGEIGLRMALGAQRGDVIGLVFGEAFLLVGIGSVIGLPLALGASRLLRNQLHGMSALDPVSIGIAVGVLAATAVVAVGLPVWRAARVAPLVALRRE